MLLLLLLLWLLLLPLLCYCCVAPVCLQASAFPLSLIVDLGWVQANLVVAFEEERVAKANDLCRQSEAALRTLLEPGSV